MVSTSMQEMDSQKAEYKKIMATTACPAAMLPVSEWMPKQMVCPVQKTVMPGKIYISPIIR